MVTYVAPTPATFKIKYPIFVTVPDATIQASLDDAYIDVDATWGDNQARGQMLLAAHWLTLAGEPGVSSGEGGSIGASGPIKRDKVGDAETEFFGWASTGGANDSGDLGLTIYGRQYYELMRILFGGVIALNGPNGLYCQSRS